MRRGPGGVPEGVLGGAEGVLGVDVTDLADGAWGTREYGGFVLSGWAVVVSEDGVRLGLGTR